MTDKHPGGRPSLYSDELAEEICDRLSVGESLIEITNDDHMPEEKTVYRWLRDERYAQFRHNYSQAREFQAHHSADEMKLIADDGRNDWMEKRGKDGELLGYQLNGEAVRRSDLRWRDRQWRAAVMYPRKYGSKVDVTSGGEQIKPADTTDAAARIAALLATANQRKAQEGE